jgi:hypothetical protein
MESEHIKADAPWWEARRLLRAARAGTLATATDGQPFASLVTPACTQELSVLMLLSGLSEHTRHLKAEPRCALMVMGAAATANPQTAPRLTITGLAEPVVDAGLKARWLAMHPYAAMYADFGDFMLWRIRPVAATYVGGFARAFRFKLREFLPEPEAAAALAAAEAEIIGHCNADHADTMALLGKAAAGEDGAWRMVAADVDGCDLALDERVARIAWRAPVKDANGLRSELIRAAREAKALLF